MNWVNEKEFFVRLVDVELNKQRMFGGAEIFQELGVPCKIWNTLVLEAAW